MEIEINTELDLVFLKPLGYLHSKSKDSAEKLKTLLDESLCKGIDSSYRPPQKDIELPKPKAEVKAIISTPVTSILSKPLPPEKVKKEAEKRFADKIKVELNEPVEIPKRPRQEKPEARSSPITEQFSKDLPLPDLSSADETSAIAIPLKPLPPLILGKRGLSRSMSSDNVSKVGLPSPSTPTGSGANINIQLSNSNGGGSNAGSSKVAAEQSGVKGPTSQKFQLNARKRLQMVKEKAAQKKLKK